ncbi:MAG: hypothetical protein M3Y87_34325 [Myxococcota bacterium]|nr:hypothetical protein [Myxococcota bacterium]
MRRGLCVRACAAIAALGALVGCNRSSDPRAMYVEDFETVCDGAPCGWVQSSGEDGRALYVETLPGDHGLELIGDGTSVRSEAAEPLASFVFTSAIGARLVARCDALSTLELRTTVELEDESTLTLGREIVPEETWSTLLDDQTLNPVDATPSPWRVRRVLGVSILKHGTGNCELDFLSIRALD